MTAPDRLQVFEKGGRICFRVRVQPRAAVLGISRVTEGVVFIRLTAPPTENRANIQLVSFLAEILGLKKSQISVESGLHSKAKTVAVSGIPEDEFLARLIPYLV